MTDADAATAADDTAFIALGGGQALHALVERFYDLMALEPAYAGIHALHPRSADGSLDGSRAKLEIFLSGWLGGPDLYVERFGHPRLRARHLPYAIGIAERDQWLACMRQAMQECGVDATSQQRLASAFSNTADWMRNKAG